MKSGSNVKAHVGRGPEVDLHIHLLVRGDDPLHPPEVSDLYAENIPNCSIAPASTTDVAAEIGVFCDQVMKK